MLLSKDDLDSYQQNGYIIVKNAFSKNITNSFQESVREIIRFQCEKAKKQNPNFPDIPNGQEFDLGMMSLEEENHQYIADISDFIDMTPELLNLSSSPTLKSTSQELLNLSKKAPIYITNCGIVLAMPRDTNYSYGWHKDTFYTLPESDYVQLWAPLIENAVTEIGTLKVCVGSHKRGWQDQYTIDNVPNRHKYKVKDEAIEMYEQKDVELKVGEALLFNSGLAHRSGDNTSNRPRFSIVSVYHKLQNEKIRPMRRGYRFQGKTPEEYYNELLGH